MIPLHRYGSNLFLFAAGASLIVLLAGCVGRVELDTSASESKVTVAEEYWVIDLGSPKTVFRLHRDRIEQYREGEAALLQSPFEIGNQPRVLEMAVTSVDNVEDSRMYRGQSLRDFGPIEHWWYRLSLDLTSSETYGGLQTFLTNDTDLYDSAINSFGGGVLRFDPHFVYFEQGQSGHIDSVIYCEDKEYPFLLACQFVVQRNEHFWQLAFPFTSLGDWKEIKQQLLATIDRIDIAKRDRLRSSSFGQSYQFEAGGSTRQVLVGSRFSFRRAGPEGALREYEFDVRVDSETGAMEFATTGVEPDKLNEFGKGRFLLLSLSASDGDSNFQHEIEVSCDPEIAETKDQFRTLSGDYNTQLSFVILMPTGFVPDTKKALNAVRKFVGDLELSNVN